MSRWQRHHCLEVRRRKYGDPLCAADLRQKTVAFVVVKGCAETIVADPYVVEEHRVEANMPSRGLVGPPAVLFAEHVR